MVTGWRHIGPTPGLVAWAEAARRAAISALAQTTEPLRCGGTWAVGLDLLPNDRAGRIGGVDLPWADLGLAPEPLHRAQLSTVHPGYPRPSDEESPAAFAFRRNRDAAHLDGLLPVGPARHRMVKEPHGWILGVALNACDADASPLVVWEGSAVILRAALIAALAPHPPETWGEVDLTKAYGAARRKVFDTCRRVVLPLRPGQATLLHRLTLHGVAPWAEGASAPPEGRIIAYFRPLLPSVRDWLERP
ncbi:hypothetical protein GC209_08085 [bacterium]|nr:hypothetical protein [bacterium]